MPLFRLVPKVEELSWCPIHSCHSRIHKHLADIRKEHGYHSTGTFYVKQQPIQKTGSFRSVKRLGTLSLRYSPRIVCRRCAPMRGVCVANWWRCVPSGCPRVFLQPPVGGIIGQTEFRRRVRFSLTAKRRKSNLPENSRTSFCSIFSGSAPARPSVKRTTWIFTIQTMSKEEGTMWCSPS